MVGVNETLSIELPRAGRAPYTYFFNQYFINDYLFRSKQTWTCLKTRIIMYGQCAYCVVNAVKNHSLLSIIKRGYVMCYKKRKNSFLNIYLKTINTHRVFFFESYEPFELIKLIPSFLKTLHSKYKLHWYYMRIIMIRYKMELFLIYKYEFLKNNFHVT